MWVLCKTSVLITTELTFNPLMVSFMCHLDGTTRWQDIWSNLTVKDISYTQHIIKSMASLFTICHCMHICMYTHTHTPKYNLSSLYSVTCMCVFRDDHLLLNNQLVCSFLTNISPTFRYSLVTCSSFVVLRPCGLSKWNNFFRIMNWGWVHWTVSQ